MVTMSSNQSATQKIKLLVVDDHPLIRQGLAAAAGASSDCQVVDEAAHPGAVVDQVRRLTPDVVILDVKLGKGSNGIDVARELRREFSAVKILVLSNYDSEPYIREFHRIGASGYLLKSAPPSAVLDAVRAIVQGEAIFDPLVLSRLTRHSGISAREAELLQLVAGGLGNREIAQRLSISISGVQVGLASVFRKLGVQNRTAAVVKAASVGIIVIEETA